MFRRSHVLSVVSCCLFLTACFTGTFLFDDEYNQRHGRSALGVTLLLTGWAGAMMGLVGWYANIPFLIALVFVADPWSKQAPRARAKWAIFFSAVAIAIGCTIFLMKRVPLPWGGGAHSFGIDRKVAGYGIGIYAWLGSFVTLTIAGIVDLVTPQAVTARREPINLSTARPSGERRASNSGEQKSSED